MADGFLSDLLKKYANGDQEAENVLKSLKRKLDQIDISETDISAKKSKNSEKRHKCDFCSKSYLNQSILKKHVKTHFTKLPCERCGRIFTRADVLKKHMKVHISKGDNLPQQTQVVATSSPLPDSSHVKSTAVIKQSSSSSAVESSNTLPPTELYTPLTESVSLEQLGGGEEEKQQNVMHRYSDDSSLNGAANVRNVYPNADDNMDLLTFFSNVRIKVQNYLKSKSQQLNGIKWYLCIQLQLQKQDKDGIELDGYPHFRSKNYIYLPSENFSEHDLNESFQKMFNSYQEYIHEGSGWTLNQVMKLEISTVQYSPIAGSSYIPTPLTFGCGECILNVMNNDEKCFLWSILASLHPTDDIPELMSHYIQYEQELNMMDIEYPVTVDKVKKIEKQNNISVNVFGFEEKEIFPLYITKLRNSNHHVNMLYLNEGKKSHYCLITNLNRFLSRTKTQSNETHFCHYCLQGFTRKDLLENHILYCSKYDPQHVELPKEGKNFLEFKDFEKQMKVPFVIYADFETFAQKIDSCKPDPAKSSITPSVRFEPCGFGYQVVSIDDRYTKAPVIYRGSDVSKKFLDCLIEEEKEIKEILEIIEPINMTVEGEREFQSSIKCHICRKYFTENTVKVKDHCHLTGKFRGAACQDCNLNFKYPKFIPVIFHNLKGFDAHIICQSIGRFKDRNITCIPSNMEKYISFSLGNLRFIDSFQFMSQSLEKLTENLAQDGLSKFKHFSDGFVNKKQAELLLRKGVYPYEYVNDESKFTETELPPKLAFYSQLTESHVSDSDYHHAQNVWKELKIKNLGEYHDLYLKTDVLLLTDVFENFRTMCMEYYNLDPCHFLTAPGLAWSSALRMSEVNLELLTDPDMYLFFESAIRGGVSLICNRYSKANNPYIPKTYDLSEPNKYIIYTDCNNLYGKAMTEPLPTGFFKWIDDVESFDVQTIPKDGDTGYILEVDLEYPKELHDQHSDYPLAPESRIISDEQLSPYSKELWRELHPHFKHMNDKLQGRVRTSKLIPTLDHKSKYILHYRNLQLYLELGIKLKKTHKVLEFQQYPWLKKYIDFDSEKRKFAKNDFEKDFFKLMNNAVFGKTMENVRNRVDIKLIQNERKLKKWVAKPSFQRFKIFNEDLVGIENSKLKLLLNKPVYVGQAILDLSKCIMYEFHYKHMKKKYGDNLKLLFTDTDSLCYEVICNDIYEDLYQDRHLFDLSNYPSNHHAYDPVNKKIPGKFKDEVGSNPIGDFAGLRPKLYSYMFRDNSHQYTDSNQTETLFEARTAKGVGKATIKKVLRHSMYLKCLLQRNIEKVTMKCIRSDKHSLFTFDVRKTAINGMDDKRYVLSDGCHTLAFGHYKIQEHIV